MAGYYDRDRRNDTITPAGTMNHPMTHHGNTSEYMVSGYPFFETHTADGTSTFGYVTQWVCVSAIGTDVTVTINGGAAAFTVPSGTVSPRFNFKCTSISVDLTTTGTGKAACVAAGLTNVKSADFPDISGFTGVQ